MPGSQGTSLILLFALIRIVILVAGLVAETNVPLADVVKLAPEPRLAVTPTAGAEEVSKLGNHFSFHFLSASKCSGELIFLVKWINLSNIFVAQFLILTVKVDLIWGGCGCNEVVICMITLFLCLRERFFFFPLTGCDWRAKATS